MAIRRLTRTMRPRGRAGPTSSRRTPPVAALSSEVWFWQCLPGPDPSHKALVRTLSSLSLAAALTASCTGPNPDAIDPEAIAPTATLAKKRRDGAILRTHTRRRRSAGCRDAAGCR